MITYYDIDYEIHVQVVPQSLCNIDFMNTTESYDAADVLDDHHSASQALNLRLKSSHLLTDQMKRKSNLRSD